MASADELEHLSQELALARSDLANTREELSRETKRREKAEGIAQAEESVQRWAGNAACTWAFFYGQLWEESEELLQVCTKRRKRARELSEDVSALEHALRETEKAQHQSRELNLRYIDVIKKARTRLGIALEHFSFDEYAVARLEVEDAIRALKLPSEVAEEAPGRPDVLPGAVAIAEDYEKP